MVTGAETFSICAGPLASAVERRRSGLRNLLAMAKEASVGTFFLPETQGHVRVRNVVNAMRPGLEQQRVHDTRHVTGGTTAALRGHGMARVLRERGLIAVPGVALQAHLV